MVLYALTIRCYAGNSNETFVGREKLGCGREIREKNEGDYTPEDGDGSKD